jgi:hypothetical protein
VGDPVLATGDRLEHDTSITLIVKRELLAVQETTVSAVQLIGNIPVEQGDKWSNAGVKQVVDKLAVVVNSGLVDRVVTTTEGNDSRPADGESVSFGA